MTSPQFNLMANSSKKFFHKLKEASQNTRSMMELSQQLHKSSKKVAKEQDNFRRQVKEKALKELHSRSASRDFLAYNSKSEQDEEEKSQI
jgi:hypothetical protein